MGVKIQWNSEASLKKVINEHKKLYPNQKNQGKIIWNKKGEIILLHDCQMT